MLNLVFEVYSIKAPIFFKVYIYYRLHTEK